MLRDAASRCGALRELEQLYGPRAARRFLSIELAINHFRNGSFDAYACSQWAVCFHTRGDADARQQQWHRYCASFRLRHVDESVDTELARRQDVASRRLGCRAHMTCARLGSPDDGAVPAKLQNHLLAVQWCERGPDGLHDRAPGWYDHVASESQFLASPRAILSREQ